MLQSVLRDRTDSTWTGPGAGSASRIINPHREADGFPPFLPERAGPASALSARKRPSPPGLTEPGESLCGRTEPEPLRPSRRSAAATRSTRGEILDVRVPAAPDRRFSFPLPRRRGSCRRPAVRGPGGAGGPEGRSVAVLVCR